MSISLASVSEQLAVPYQGDGACVITGVASIEDAKEGDITFLANPKYKNLLQDCSASVVILSSKNQDAWSGNALISDKPELTFALVARNFLKQKPSEPGIHPSAVVDPTASIHETAVIGPNVVIEYGVSVGARSHVGPGCVLLSDASIKEDTTLVANVTIYDDVQIGSRVLIHGGSVIGSDGFGNAKDGEKWVKIPQLGRVIVGDDVEIGANVAIDRGAIKDTLIGNGTKIDNLVHIAHNVQVGEHCAIAGLVGIAGSAKLGKNVAIGGASAMTGHITICDNVMFTGMSMITRSTREPGVYSSGMPAEPNAVWRKNVARFRRLEKLENKLKEMEDRLKSFEAEKV